MRSPRVVCLGINLLDVLVRPTPGPPALEGWEVLREFRITAAGTAAGPAVDLTKLGAEVIGMGVLGADYEGDLVTDLMSGHGVDVSRIVHADGESTHVSLLFIGPDGERNPVMIRPGASRAIALDDIDFDAIAAADVLHIGGADVLGDFTTGPLVEVVRFARERGVLTTFDVLANCDGDTIDRLTPALRETNYFFPNERQLAGLTGSEDPSEGIARLREIGVEHVIATFGEQGSVLVGPEVNVKVPAFDVELLDTTGCGDAYVAGFIVAIANGWDLEAAGWLGSAASGLVATGLGSDAGIVDLPSTLEFMASEAPTHIAKQVESAASS